MCWWPQKPDEERQWAEPDDLTIVTALPHNPASRERFDEGAMESVKTQYLPETRAFEVQSANPRRTPSTPQKRPNSSGKILELTPLWEQILRYNRLPQNVEKVKVFAELAMRLSDPEWEVRQHAMRVLVDLIPVIPDSNNDLDALMIPVVLTEVTYNLEHPAPAVRKSALDVLSTYIKYSSDPEFVLRSVVSQGLESPAANSNLAMSVLVCIPPLLQDLQSILTKRQQSFSHQSLVQIVTALSKKLVQNSFQQKTIDAMVKIRELVGETRFDHFLESYYPQVKRDFDVLCKVFEVRSNNSNLGDSGIDIQPESTQITDTNDNEEDDWSDNEAPLHRSSNVTSSTSTTERSRFELSKEELHKLESNSKLFSRTETDSNADSQEKRDEDAVDEEDYAQSESDVSVREHNSSDTGEQDSENDSDGEKVIKKKPHIDDVFGEMTIHDNEDSMDILDDGRVVMETEIKFNSETAITMTILEEKNDEGKLQKENTVSLEESEEQGNRFTNDFVMHVVEDDENSLKRTPRRVRFGGEVVKLRTPDSDVTIEIHEVDPKEAPILKFTETKLEEVSKEPPKTPKKTKTKKKVEDLTISGKESILYSREDKVVKRPRSSHIPLPIVPALSRPQLPWRKKPEQPTEDEDSSIPNCDGGESLTSGSEGEHPPPRSGFRDVRVAQEADEWQRLGFIDQGQLENLVRKESFRFRIKKKDVQKRIDRETRARSS
ncbi:hypothetical protein J6590_006390 [Homalodisca vitripennis]|nr:hypothetical protein J6590_006390 [Homalodisca vitripennis]